MLKAVILLVKDALKLVECSLVDMLIPMADEHLWLMVVEDVVMLSMMLLSLSAGRRSGVMPSRCHPTLPWMASRCWI